jgi:hypothetical protein
VVLPRNARRIELMTIKTVDQREKYRTGVLAAKGFTEDPRRQTWFNLKARKSLSHQAIRDYDEKSWKAPLSSIVPIGEFWFYSSGGLAIQVCEEQLALWDLKTLRPVIKVPGQFVPNPIIVTNIDDPRYWEPLSDEQVIEKMQGGQAGSPIWNRGEGELKIREFKRSRQNQSPAGAGAATVRPAADFSCITSSRLRAIAERDWKECCAALDARCWKSVLILIGGIVETVILSMLIRRKTKALSSTSARGFQQKDIQRWTLGQMIAVSEELKFFGPAIRLLPRPLKEYRNLAHPGDEIREGLSVSESSALASFHALNLILDELSKVKRRRSNHLDFTFVRQ